MIFGKKKSLDDDLGKLWEIDPEPIVEYNTVMEWLVGLSAEDYTKVCQVAAINRQANYESCKVLGVDCVPTTYITPPELPADSVLDPSTADNIADQLLEDDAPVVPKSKKAAKK